MLAAVLAWELVAGPTMFLPEGTSKPPSVRDSFVISAQAPPENPPINKFSEFIARPLFAPSRRPPPPKTDSNSTVEVSKPESFDLVGVIISADERMALLQTLGTGEVMRAVEGQTVGGWKVQAIKPTEVELKRGNASELIKINDAAVANEPSAKNTTPAFGTSSSVPAYNGIAE
jgi:hypothetical protein